VCAYARRRGPPSPFAVAVGPCQRGPGSTSPTPPMSFRCVGLLRRSRRGSRASGGRLGTTSCRFSTTCAVLAARQSPTHFCSQSARRPNEPPDGARFSALSNTTPHTLRRTDISIALLANRFDVLWVMSQVGHAQLKQRVDRQHGRAFDALVRQALCEWRDPDSNRGHHDFQSCALPTELSRRAGA
jgi:hypothetical protein